VRASIVGHLFSGRYRALLVDAESPGYMRTVCDYVQMGVWMHVSNLLASRAKKGTVATRK
jgi:hypothetical protein